MTEITISTKRYKQLLKAEEELSALHAGGVDNWEWYGDSLSDAGIFDDEESEEDIYGDRDESE